ncbi:MFS transporter [Salinibacillus xinjiangensis]|uniref:MFS transporter n=1 Tax=Salinibacillus xinjiangensis TaxID=1229268 RepID=A0A6G1X1P2_9BACI|nr:MFS transporter [Salinibacillus xinjiangensis]MRG84854.1 MFS transporter [Salinibacillus xinjiangensis]
MRLAIKTQNTQVPNFTPWIMLTILLSTQIAVAFVGRSIAPLGPLIEENLLLTKAQIGMLPAALFLGQSIISLPSGMLVDRLGSRGLLLMLSLCLGLSFMLFSFLSSFIIMLILVVIGGFGYGAMHPTSNRGIIYWFPVNKRGTAMGIKQMGVTAGSALSALILLPIAVEWGWRAASFSAAILLICIGMFSFIFYQDPPLETHDLKNKTSVKGFLSSFSELAKNKSLLAISIAAIGLTAAQLSFLTYIVFYLDEELKLSLYLAGLLFVVTEVFGSIGRIAWGVISDKIFSGKRIIVLIIISIITAVNSIIIILLPENISLLLIFPFVALFGFCITGFNGMWMNSASETVSKDKAGTATGFSLMLGSLGVVFGPPIFGGIVDRSGSYTYAWLFLAFLMVVVTLILFYANTPRVANK